MTDVDLYAARFGDPVPGVPPLLLVHGGGATIETAWSALIPRLTPTREVVAVELQGHGRSPDDGQPASFARSAGHVAAVLDRLGIDVVDVLGFSNGGNVALHLALLQPTRVRRQVVVSSPTRRDGMVDGFWDGLRSGTVDSMPAVFLEADRALNPDPRHQQRLFDLDWNQMLGLEDMADTDLRSITTPTLLVVGDRDVVRAAHVAQTAELLPDARLVVLPGGHGDHVGEAGCNDPSVVDATVPWILRHLDSAVTA